MSAPFRSNNCVPMWLTHGNDREYIYIYIYIYEGYQHGFSSEAGQFLSNTTHFYD